jgi:fibronectin type 3 domain-containing protein
MFRKSLVMMLMFWICLGVFHCGKYPQEPDRLNYGIYPKTPNHLSIAIGDRRIHLSWEIVDSLQIGLYYIYRSDSLTSGYRRYDSSKVAEYIDHNVQNGRVYAYQVSAQNISGYEGPFSEVVAARPGFYTLTINSGAIATRSLSVTLVMVAPEGTVYSLISNDSTFRDAGWELYVTQKSWELLPGDGKKQVYAKFRGQDGSQMDGTVHDEIILDTDAGIEYVRFNSENQPFRSGEILKIRLASEIFGTASVDLGDRISGLRLYDDATHGDTRSNDGIYSLDWTIPVGFEIINGTLTAQFIDAVGNTARFVTAEPRLVIKNSPQPVFLLNPVPYGQSHDRLYLSWTSYNGMGFIHYSVYRNDSVRVDSSSTLVGIIATSTVSSLVDSNLTENKTYFYRIYVTDALGYSTGSNVAAGKTAMNVPPTAVHCELSYLQTQQSVLLSWTKNMDRDFGNYRIFRSERADVSNTSPLVTVLTDRSLITYQDRSLNDKSTYWYAVYVYDLSGQASRSNVVSITTSTLSPPKPVIMAAPASYIAGALRLSWSTSTDDHFQSYRIYRSKSAKVDSTTSPIALLNSASITSYDDMGLETNTTYYYRTFVYDAFGHSSGSNTVSGKTLQ